GGTQAGAGRGGGYYRGGRIRRVGLAGGGRRRGLGDSSLESREVQNVLPGGYHCAADHLVCRRPAAGRDEGLSRYRLLDGARDGRRAATPLRPRRLELARLEGALLR